MKEIYITYIDTQRCGGVFSDLRFENGVNL